MYNGRIYRHAELFEQVTNDRQNAILEAVETIVGKALMLMAETIDQSMAVSQ